MKSLRRAWLLASLVILWQGCSVNDSGLTSDGGPAIDSGTGGVRTDGPVADAGAGAGGSAAGGRGGAAGVAGSSVGGVSGSAGSGSVAGRGGNAAGAGGSVAGASGSSGGAVAGSGGGVVAGTGGGSVAGMGGGGGSVAGTGGSVAGASGSAGGAIAGMGGGAVAGAGGSIAGASGSGGSVAGAGGRGAAGRGGSGGRGGVGGRVCADYPAMARSFVPPNDNNRAHCYWPHGNMQTWSQARMTCTNEGGHLVTILSEEENLFVVSIAQFSPMYSDTWIGATDGRTGSNANGPGTYSWVTGEVWNFDAWKGEEPDGACDECSGGQPCTCDHRGTLVSDGTWSDRWEGTPRGFVCEATP